MNVQDLYEQRIKSLSAADRLRLAVLMLNDIPPQSVVDASESWADEDLQDFAQASWQQIEYRQFKRHFSAGSSGTQPTRL